MRIRRVFSIAAVLVLSGGVFAACGDDDDNGDSTDDDTTVTTAGSSATTAASGAGSTLTLIAADFAFDKATLAATAGQEVSFSIQNNGAVTHNLTIDDLDIDKDAESGKTEDAGKATPDAGTYEYHCEYHPSAMKGTLTVS